MKIKGKYDLLLTLFLIIIFIALGVTLIPYFYGEVKSEIISKKALSDFDDHTGTINNQELDEEDVEAALDARRSLEDLLDELDINEATKSENGEAKSINYQAVGKIEIPKTNINYPIYGQIAKDTLEAGVAIAYGPGLNQTGNTVIYGHNFRNSKFFSNNKKLKNGDKIYITDLDNNRIEYNIYSVYYTTPTDANYMVRDTEGRTEISLQTCSDDNSRRLIIWATAN